MGNVLEIGKPFIEHSGNEVCVASIIKEGNICKKCVIKVADEFEQYIVTEAADAFFAIFYPYAMMHGLNIKIEGGLSEEIYYNFKETLGQILPKKNKLFHSIQIETTIVSNTYYGSAVGCGFSGGVDSYCTLLKNIVEEHSSYKITHLCLFNIAVGGSGNEVDAKAYEEKKKKMAEIASHFGLKFFFAKCNSEDFYSPFEHRRVQGGLMTGIILAFSKLFSKYLVASDWPIYDVFDFSKDCDDRYRFMQTYAFSTKNTQFIYDGIALNRVEKMPYIMDEEIVQKTLNVCGYEIYNCGICEKCIRTQLTLDIYGKIELFSNVFDIESYRKHKIFYLARYCGRRAQGAHYREVNRLYLSHYRRYPIIAYIYSPFYWLTGIARNYFLKREQKYYRLRRFYRTKLKKIM